VVFVVGGMLTLALFFTVSGMGFRDGFGGVFVWEGSAIVVEVLWFGKLTGSVEY
jgi:hypothetical protein